jgi:hypothetical protein
LSTSPDVTKKSELGGEELIQEGLRIVEDARKEGTTLRITGGVAIFHLVEKNAAIKELILKYRKAGKSSANFADLDLVGYSKDTKKINKLFLEKYLFQKDKIINALFGDRRRIYYQPEGTYHVDIFLDKLEFNHDIDIRGRLEMDFPDLNVADLLLTKLQIHYINDKDLLDMIALSTLDKWEAEVNVQRVATVLANDWGFYYDAISNLRATLARITEFIGQSQQEAGLQTCAKRIQRLVDYIEQFPKSKNWVKAAKNGTGKQWWREIENVLR